MPGMPGATVGRALPPRAGCGLMNQALPCAKVYGMLRA